MKTVILLSGGVDSTTLLHEYVKLYGRENIRALGFDYGQRHKKELTFAYLNATKFGVPLKSVDLSSLKQILSSSLTDTSIAIPEGLNDPESAKKTVVPNRNMILLSIGIAYAISLDFDSVSYAAHKGGYDTYPDCRPEFIDAMDKAVGLCDWKRVAIDTPYISLSKGDIVKKGVELGVFFTQTWSCYVGGDLHCGRCGTCCKRILAFKEAGVADPTGYADPSFVLKES